MGKHVDVRRQVELDAVVALAVRHPDIEVEEADLLDVPDELGGMLEVDAGADRHALARHLEEHLRLCRVAAAVPQPHRPRVARRRRVAAPGAVEQQRVGIEPAHPTLGLRQDKAVLHEGPGQQIEFAQHHGVAAAARQSHDRSVMRARPRQRATPDPVLALRRREGIDVEQDLPRGLVEAKAVQCGAPPQTAWIPGVEPEIVEPRSAARDEGELVGPVKDRRQSVAVGGEPCVAEVLQRAFGLGLDPGKRAPPLDFFEPQVGIVVGLSDCRPGIEGHAGNLRR